MCGIVGVVGPRAQQPDYRRRIALATNLLAHRGPDDTGVATIDHCTFGHRRLSVIDLTSGHQPMASLDQRFLITYNGEIYNYREIRRDLESRGHTFRTRTDTEVVLESYRRFGPECVQLFNGMFSFAVFDHHSKELFLCRDRLGIKPLYYYSHDEHLWFFSELKAVPALFDSLPPLNHRAIDCYLSLRYVIGPDTLFRNIRKLEPGQFLLWRNGETTRSHFWELSEVAHSAPPADCRNESTAASQLRNHLERAVADRLIADVPVGVMLSGGLDSTIVAALAARHSRKQIKTFAISTSGNGQWDERPFARLASSAIGTDHYEITVTADEYLDQLPQLAWDMDDLVADPASLLLREVSRLAREHVTVTLSGEGADELFAGYSYELLYRALARQRRFESVPLAIRNLLRPAARLSKRLQRYYQRSALSLREYVLHLRGPAGQGLSYAHRLALWKDNHKTELLPLNAHAERAFAGSPERDPVQIALYADTRSWLPDNLLTKADRMSMAHSLELRVPFLDHRVVEFTWSLPVEHKLFPNPQGGYTRKHLLRTAFADLVPETILTREKQGFSLNWKEILCGKGKDLAREIFSAGMLDDLFNPTALFDLIEAAEPDNSSACQALFSTLLLALWLEKFRSAVRSHSNALTTH